jgi:hypothetical protein
MKQSKLMSMLETCLSTAIGFVVALTTQLLVFPLFGFSPPLSHNLLIGAIFTVVSVARGFLIRRLFEALHIRRPLSAFMQAVIAERHRQVDVEGYDAVHDAGHTPRELAQAGAAYLIGPDRYTLTDYEADEDEVPVSGRLIWPWALEYWKPREPRRNLVRGCALGIAAGELADAQRKTKRRLA